MVMVMMVMVMVMMMMMMVLMMMMKGAHRTVAAECVSPSREKKKRVT